MKPDKYMMYVEIFYEIGVIFIGKFSKDLINPLEALAVARDLVIPV